MIVIMAEHASPEQIQHVIEKLHDGGFDIHRSTGTTNTVLGVVGDTATVDIRDYEVLDGVKEVIRISEPYKLAGRTFKPNDSLVTVGSTVFGGNKIAM